MWNILSDDIKIFSTASVVKVLRQQAVVATSLLAFHARTQVECWMKAGLESPHQDGPQQRRPASAHVWHE